MITLIKNKSIVRTAVISFLTISQLVGCNDENEQIQPQALPACFLTSESILGDPPHRLFEFSSGNLTRIAHVRSVGDTIDITEIFPEKIVTTNVDKLYPTNSSIITLFDARILARSPSMAITDVTVNDVLEINKQLSFRYDQDGRMIEVAQRAILGLALEFRLTIDYDERNNVKRLNYEYPDYTDKISIVPTGYDSKPTPYTIIRGWKFIAHSSAWNSANHYAVLAALSQNNPRGYLHLVNNKETYAMTYKYLYNEHGFPTQRDQVYQTATSDSHTAYEYTYTCQ